jgi:uncharacterized LabA/DUF88 family protein
MTIGIFVDGANMHPLGLRFDYGILKEWIADGREVEEANYFGGTQISPLSKLNRFYRYVKGAGFCMHLRQSVFISSTGKYKQGGVDTALVIHALKRGIYERRFETFVLVSGDSDFLPLVEEMEQNGIDVEIISMRETCHPCYPQKYKMRFMDDFLKTIKVEEL